MLSTKLTISVRKVAFSSSESFNISDGGMVMVGPAGGIPWVSITSTGSDAIVLTVTDVRVTDVPDVSDTVLFFLYSVSNSGDVSSLFLGFWVTGVFSIKGPLFITHIWADTILLKPFAGNRGHTELFHNTK